MKWNLRDGIACNKMKGNDNAWRGIKMASRIKFNKIRINDALHEIKWEEMIKVLHEIKWRLGNGNAWSEIKMALHETIL